MNKLIIIGSLGKDPELRTTASGINVCSFSVGVTDKRSSGQEKTTTWFRVSAWRQLGELCQKWLVKGKKVCVTGSVSVSTYEGKDGATRASLDVTADDIEFLSNKEDAARPATVGEMDKASGMQVVDTTDDLPF